MTTHLDGNMLAGTTRRGVRRGHHHRGGPVRLLRHPPGDGRGPGVHRRAGPGGPLPELRRGGAAAHPVARARLAGPARCQLPRAARCPASERTRHEQPAPARRPPPPPGLRRRPGTGRRGAAPGRRRRPDHVRGAGRAARGRLRGPDLRRPEPRSPPTCPAPGSRAPGALAAAPGHVPGRPDRRAARARGLRRDSERGGPGRDVGGATAAQRGRGARRRPAGPAGGAVQPAPRSPSTSSPSWAGWTSSWARTSRWTCPASASWAASTTGPAGPGLPGAPRVRVVGLALMGGVNVKRRPVTARSRRRTPKSARPRTATSLPAFPRPCDQAYPLRAAAHSGCL